MVKFLKTFFVYAICMIICMLSITGCEINNEEKKTIEDKTNEEISYLENKILTCINRYTKGEYDTDDGLNWNEIEENVIEINEVLDTLVLDFTELKIPNEDIITFRNRVNSLSISATNRDMNLVLQENSGLYSLLPTYLEKYSKDKNEINKMKLKALVISSYVYANSLDWANAKSTIALAETKYKEMIDDIDYVQEYSYNLNKVYILLGEVKNAIDIEELELTKLKYINFIEKIN